MATSILRLALRLSSRNTAIMSRNTGLKSSNISRTTPVRTAVSTPSGQYYRSRINSDAVRSVLPGDTTSDLCPLLQCFPMGYFHGLQFGPTGAPGPQGLSPLSP
ncbi:hypothetical protein INR49_006534 [Caranx melampygus]|nr:hypothetical protein INR49_006534 [Caranx melampygus]